MTATKIRRVAWAVAALMALLAAAPSFAQSDPKLVEGAKKEAVLSYFTSMSLAESKPLADEFEKQYPFIKVDVFRASGEKILNRVMTETRAGRWDFDVASLSEIGTFVEQKLIGPYVSPESSHYINELKDPHGYWSAIYINYMVPGYNTRMIPERDTPKRWEDLIESKWRGKIAIDPEDYLWYITLVTAWGQERAGRYMRALAKQDIQWRKGHSLITQLMSAGEFPLGIVYAHRTESDKKKGAPIDWVNTVDPIVVTHHAIGIAAKPKHPNAARLFVDFALSKKAQELFRSANRVPARRDVEPPSPKMEQSKLKLRLVPQDSSTRYNEYVKDFRAIFGL